MSSAPAVRLTYKKKQDVPPSYTLRVENNRKVQLYGFLDFKGPKDWSFKLTNPTEPNFQVAPDDVRDLEVTLIPDRAARPGEYSLTFEVSDSQGRPGPIYASVNIPHQVRPPVTLKVDSRQLQARSGESVILKFSLENNRTGSHSKVVVTGRVAGLSTARGSWEGPLDREASGQLSFLAPERAGTYHVEVTVDMLQPPDNSVELVVHLDRSVAPVLDVKFPGEPVPIGQVPDCKLTVKNPSNAPLQGNVFVRRVAPGSPRSDPLRLQPPLDPGGVSAAIQLPVDAQEAPGAVEFVASLEPQFLVDGSAVDVPPVEKGFKVVWARPFWPAIRLDAWVSVPSTAGDPTGQVGGGAGSAQFVAYRDSSQGIHWALIVAGTVPDGVKSLDGPKAFSSARPSLFRLDGPDIYNLFMVYRCEPGFGRGNRERFNLASYKWNDTTKGWEENLIPWAVNYKGDDVYGKGDKTEEDKWFIPPSAGEPSGVTSKDGFSRHVVYRDEGGQIRDVVWRPTWWEEKKTGEGWGHFVPTVSLGSPSAVGDPTAYVGGKDGSSIHVVYRDRDGQAHLLSCQENMSWSHTPLPTQGREPAANARFSVEARQGSQHIVYRDVHGQVQLLWRGSPVDDWKPIDTSSWIKQPVKGGADPVVFAPRKDGPVFIAVLLETKEVHLVGYLPGSDADPTKWTVERAELTSKAAGAPPAEGTLAAFGADGGRFLTYRAAEHIVVVRFE